MVHVALLRPFTDRVATIPSATYAKYAALISTASCSARPGPAELAVPCYNSSSELSSLTGYRFECGVFAGRYAVDLACD